MPSGTASQPSCGRHRTVPTRTIAHTERKRPLAAAAPRVLRCDASCGGCWRRVHSTPCVLRSYCSWPSQPPSSPRARRGRLDTRDRIRWSSRPTSPPMTFRARKRDLLLRSGPWGATPSPSPPSSPFSEGPDLGVSPRRTRSRQTDARVAEPRPLSPRVPGQRARAVHAADSSAHGARRRPHPSQRRSHNRHHHRPLPSRHRSGVLSRSLAR
jgi:hypothetical protein